MCRLILAAALAAASASFAFAPAFADGAFSDDPGVNDLGVDIGGVNLTPSGVHAYLAAQSPEMRRELVNACNTYLTHPAGAGEATLAFCGDIGGKA